MKEIELLREITTALSKEAGAIPEQSRIQLQFARFQINNVCKLAEGFLILEQGSKLEVAGCLARPVVEAFLNLKAAIADSSFAASKCVTDIDAAIKLDETRRDKCPIPEVKARLQATIDANKKIRDNMRKHHGVKKVRKWNAKEIAEVAGLVPFYDVTYSTFHTAIHAALDGNSIESSPNYVSLVAFHTTVIVMDTLTALLQQFAPEKIPAYEADLKRWRKAFEDNSAGS